MRKMFLLFIISILVFNIVSCGRSENKENGTSGTGDNTTSKTISESDTTGVTSSSSITLDITTDTYTQTTNVSETTKKSEETYPEPQKLVIKYVTDENSSLASPNVDQNILFISKFDLNTNPEMIFAYTNYTWKFEIENNVYTIDSKKIYFEAHGEGYLLKWDIEAAGFMPEYGKQYTININGYDKRTFACVYVGETKIKANLGKTQSGEIKRDAPYINFDINGGNSPFSYLQSTNNIALTMIFKNDTYGIISKIAKGKMPWSIYIDGTEYKFDNYTVRDDGSSVILDFDVESKGFIPYKSMRYEIKGVVYDKDKQGICFIKQKTVVANIIAAMIPDPSKIGSEYDYNKITPISGTYHMADENYTKLFDGNVETKMFENADNREAVIFKTNEAIKLVSYSLVTANDNDAYGRVPDGWKLYGSVTGKGDDWKVIDSRENNPIKDINNYREYNFKLNSSESFMYYKIEFTGDDVQFSEMQLYV